jgi:K+/H+ antiporter YhaU regulatory subunit KhtT
MFFDKYRDMFGPFKFRKRKEMGEGGDRDKFDGRDSEVIGVYSNIKKQRNEEMSEEEKTHSSISKIMDGIFGESKVDKVLEKYFVITEDEKKTEPKKTKKSNSIETLAETTEQRLAAEFIMKESEGSKFLGKTNKNNLVIESQGVQIKVTTKGEVL